MGHLSLLWAPSQDSAVSCLAFVFLHVKCQIIIFPFHPVYPAVNDSGYGLSGLQNIFYTVKPHFQVTGSIQQISDKCTGDSPGASVCPKDSSWLQQPPHQISGTHSYTKTASFWSQGLYGNEPPCVLPSAAGPLLYLLQ